MCLCVGSQEVSEVFQECIMEFHGISEDFRRRLRGCFLGNSRAFNGVLGDLRSIPEFHK